MHSLLQALRAVSHNYPNVIVACWEQVSTIVYKMLRLTIPEVTTRSWDLHGGNTVGSAAEKVITAAIKVNVHLSLYFTFFLP